MLPLSGLNILSANEQPLRYSQPIKCPNEPYILILLKGKSLGVENRYSLCHCLFRTIHIQYDVIVTWQEKKCCPQAVGISESLSMHYNQVNTEYATTFLTL